MLKNNKKELKVISIWELMPTFAIPKYTSGHRPKQDIFYPLYGGGIGNDHIATCIAKDT